eukprot:m.23798 g.23798  ORF g.23798 m.23798 type:complete len:328 (+) comp11432_c0_seq1:75-1058(+)
MICDRTNGILVLIIIALLLCHLLLVNLQPSSIKTSNATLDVSSDASLCLVDCQPTLAVVMTVHVHTQLPSVLSRLLTWREYPPCRHHDNSPAKCNADLVIYAENQAGSVLACEAIHRHAELSTLLPVWGLSLQCLHADLQPSEDKWPRGPSIAFYKLQDMLASRYDYILHLEPDVTPIRAGWFQEAQRLTRLYQSLHGKEGVWMLGSIPLVADDTRRNRPIGDRVHLNGNGLYHLGSAGFRTYLKQVEASQRLDTKQLQTSPRGNAYDVDLLTFLLHPSNSELLQQVWHRFVASSYIQNRWRSQWSKSHLLRRYPQTYLVHGGTEQP